MLSVPFFQSLTHDTPLSDAVAQLNFNGHISPSNGEIGVGAKKKTKYVPLYSKEGQAKAVVQLPGKTILKGTTNILTVNYLKENIYKHNAELQRADPGTKLTG